MREEQRAGGANGVGPFPPSWITLRLRPAECKYPHAQKPQAPPKVVGAKKAPRHGGAFVVTLGRDHLPSSNTTSRFTDTVVSPGDTEVSISALAIIACARTIGTGGWKPPPSLMLTMRRTRRPNAFA